MTRSLMDTGDDDVNSPSSLSEECNSNTAGSEREGEAPQVGKTGMKRREKNRDAARKTRRKQTERADELHEELQRLEQANSAFQKEIADLKKEFLHYTDVLAHHEPHCLLRASKEEVSSLDGGQTSTSSPQNLPQASTSIPDTPPSVSAYLTSSLVLQTLDCVENAHLGPTLTTLLMSSDSTTELASSSSPTNSVTRPHSIPFSLLSPPHSLFSKEAVNHPRPTNATPVYSDLLSTSMTSSVLTPAAQPQSEQDVIHDASNLPANACFSTFDSPKVVPSYLHLTGETQGFCLNVPEFQSAQCSGDPHPLCTLLPQTLQDSALQFPTVSLQANLESSPASDFALKPSSRQMTPSPASLLSLLTVPSPLNSSQTTSSSEGLLSQPPPSPAPLDDPSTDLSLSELLEVNDWILSRH